jgi:hypothetical protein
MEGSEGVSSGELSGTVKVSNLQSLVGRLRASNKVGGQSGSRRTGKKSGVEKAKGLHGRSMVRSENSVNSAYGDSSGFEGIIKQLCARAELRLNVCGRLGTGSVYRLFRCSKR